MTSVLDWLKKKKVAWDFGVIGSLLLTFSTFFLYKLGQSSLVSWDEAWYAEISRNILKSGELFRLVWNGEPYIDHPPAGFWVISVGMWMFGYEEFGARIGSAVSGLVCLVFVYLIGKELFSRYVGLLAALSLPSAYWFLFRARSGNLDVILTMFFLTTFYFAILVKRKEIYFLPFFISLALLVLTKSMVSVTIIPALVILFLGKDILNIKRIKYFILGLLVFSGIIGYWFFTENLYKDNFVETYFLKGLPGVSTVENDYQANLLLAKEYLHSGVGKWFWPGILTSIVGLFLLKRNYLVTSIFVVSFMAPFVFSNKGQIWHMIPVFPFLILNFYAVGDNLVRFGAGMVSKIALRGKLKLELSILGMIIVSVFGGYYSFMQLRRSWYEFVDIPAYVSDEEILSKEAGKLDLKFYIDGDFGPAAAFYSGKRVDRLGITGITDVFSRKEDFVLITQQWKLDHFKVSKNDYIKIGEDRDKILIIRKN